MKLKYLNRGLLLLLTTSTSHLLQAQTDTTSTANTDEPVIVNNYSGYRNIGFDRQSAKYVTSAISTIYGAPLSKTFTLNLGNTLYGRAAGLTALQGGNEPGAGVPTLWVRNRNTFGDAGSGPLYVIDGYLSNGSATSNGFMQLVPEEIESITLLKDASATAVYGSRAANGVILVTTKRGEAGSLKVNFTTRQGFNQAQQLPKFFNSYDYARLYNEALINDSLPAKYTQADLDAYQKGTDPYGHPNVNWYDEVLKKASYASSYNLSLSGGDNIVRYSVVLNALRSAGLYKDFGDFSDESSNSRYNRYNFRTNLDIRLNKRLSAEFKIGGSVEEIKNPYDYNTASTFSLLASLPPNAFPVRFANGRYGGNSLFSNPVGNLASTGFFRSNARTILSSLKFTHQLDMITPGLSASAAISINNYFKSGSRRTKTYARYSYQQAPSGADSTALISGSQGSSLVGTEETLDQYRNLIIQAFLNYHRTFGKSDLTGMLMFNRDEVTLFAPSGDLTNTPSGPSTDPYRHNNASGRFTYVYNDRYIAEFSGSYMASNIFPKGKRGGFFPAGSVGWIISNEGFLRNNQSLNFLKLRGSYGQVGNDVIVPLGLSNRYSLYTQGYSSSGYFLGTSNNNSGGLAEGVLANPNITWEREKSYNIGLDATLLKHFDLSLDVYNRDRTGIIVSAGALIPQFIGAVSPSLNQGKSNNKGFEVLLSYSSKSKKAFQFFVEGNLSYNKNRIVFNAEALQLNTKLYRSGFPFGQPFGYKAIGFFTQAEVAQRASNPKSVPAPTTEIIRPGDIKYQDIGGPEGKPDGIIDDNDVQPIGNTGLPKLVAGLHAGFQYKGFDLDFVLQGVSGNTVYLGGNYYQAFQSNGQIGPIALNRWTPQTAATADYPRLSSKNNLNNYLTSTFWQRNGEFIKLRSAEIGYTLPSKFSQRLKTGSIRIFVNGTNLFSIDKIPFGDPEALNGYPVIRTVTGGVKVSL